MGGLEFGDLLFIGEQHHEPEPPQGERGCGVAGEVVVGVQAVHGHAPGVGIAGEVGADHARGVRGCSTAEATALQQHGVHAGFGEVVGGGGSDHSPADDDGVSAGRQGAQGLLL